MYSRCARRAAWNAALRQRPLQKSCLTVEAGTISSVAGDPLEPGHERTAPAQSAVAPEDVLDVIAQSLQSSSSSTLSPADVTHDDMSLAKESKGSKDDRTDTFSNRAVLIRPDNGVKSIVSALSIVQAVEQKFGKIRDFKANSDRDAKTAYLPFIFVNFENPESVQRVLEWGQQKLKVVAEPWDRTKLIDGGVSLADIQDYLRPAKALDDASLKSEVPEEAGAAIIDSPEMLDTGSSVSPATSPEEQDLFSLTTASEDEKNAARAALEDSQTVEQPPSQQGAVRPLNETYVSLAPMKLRDRGPPFESVMYDRYNVPQIPSERRLRTSRALLRWGGFYSYEFRNPSSGPSSSDEPEAPVHTEEALVEEPRPQAENVQRSRERVVREATFAMRASIVRQRMRLRDSGDPSHGLFFRDGRTQVSEWEPRPKDETQPSSTASTNIPPRASSNKEKAQIPNSEEVAEVDTTAAAPDVDVMRTVADIEKKAKHVRKKVGSSSDEPISGKSLAPPTMKAKTPTPKVAPPKRQPIPASPSPTLSSASKSASSTSSTPQRTGSRGGAESAEDAKKRKARQASRKAARATERKAEAERNSQTSFKDKLLGWVRQSWR